MLRLCGVVKGMFASEISSGEVDDVPVRYVGFVSSRPLGLIYKVPVGMICGPW